MWVLSVVVTANYTRLVAGKEMEVQSENSWPLITIKSEEDAKAVQAAMDVAHQRLGDPSCRVFTITEVAYLKGQP